MPPTAGMPWVKLYTEFLDDPKVGFVDELAQLLLVKLYLVAGECDAEGYLANGDELLTKEHLAWRLRLPIEEFCERWEVLQRAGLVAEEEDGALVVPTFQERQGRSQSEKREKWRRYSQQYRERQVEGHESTEHHEDITPEPIERQGAVMHDDSMSHGAREEGEGEGEEKREETEDGAGAPPVPTSWAGWAGYLETVKNRPALVYRMVEVLYTGLDPPSYGAIGAMAKKMGRGVNGYRRLMGLLWEYSCKPPQGDLLPYLLRVHQGKERDRGQSGIDPNSEEWRRRYKVEGVTMPITSEGDDDTTQ